MGANRSLGIDNKEAESVVGSTWRTIMMSARVPEYVSDDPNCSCSFAVRPWRVSFPMSRMFSGFKPSVVRISAGPGTVPEQPTWRQSVGVAL